MNNSIGLEQCLSFINCQMQSPQGSRVNTGTKLHWRAVTISRQAGSGAHSVAEHLVEYLQAHAPNEACRWTVFDKNLVERVLEDHNLPARLARFMPEDRIGELSDIMDQLFGLHPPYQTLVHQAADTILHLAEIGHVILIGRGAHVITGKLPDVFHVRLVGSLEKRLQRFQELNQVSRQAARALMQKEDLGRSRYLKKYFNKDIDDPLLYHMVLNTDLLSYRDAAQIITSAMLQKQELGTGGIGKVEMRAG